MPVPSVFPSALPITAPANNAVPFTRPPSPPSGAVTPSPVIQPPISPAPLPRPAPPAPRPVGTPSGAGVGVSTFPGVPAVPGAGAAGGAGAVGAAAGVAAGAAGFLAFDLFFPPPASAPEAPSLPVPNNPINPPQTRPAPLTQPSEGIRPDAIYRLEATVKTQQLFVPYLSNSQERAGEYAGSQLENGIRLYVTSYNTRDQFEEKTMTSLRIVYLRGGTLPLTQPNFTPLLPPLTAVPPLQDPTPKDDKGDPKPILFIPPSPPVIIPFTRPPRTAPAPAPTILPSAPPAPIVPAPNVVPERKPDFPPVGVPDYKPGVPVFPGGDPLPLVRPGTSPSLPSMPTRAPQPGETRRVPPGILIPDFKPSRPTGEDGKFDPSQQLTPPPPRPPIQTRQKGADCCECPPCPELNPPEPPAETMRSVVLGVENSGSYALPARTQRVAVVVTSVGSAVRSQSGGSSGKNIFFIGSYAFGWSDLYGDRKPVSYAGNVFPCPDSATHFNFQLNYGSQAVVTAYYLVATI